MEWLIVMIFLLIILMSAGIYYAWYLIFKGVKKELKDIFQPSNKNNRRCPECGRIIPFDAKICPYCKKDFEE